MLASAVVEDVGVHHRSIIGGFGSVLAAPIGEDWRLSWGAMGRLAERHHDRSRTSRNGERDFGATGR